MGVWRPTSGRTVFVISGGNAPCPGVGLKPLFLAADFWRRRGVADQIDITVVTERDTFTGLAADDRTLEAQLRALGATVHRGVRLREIDPDRRTITATSPGARSVRVDYDAAHVVPPYRGQHWLMASGLADPTSGLIRVDPATLEHLNHPGIWSLGDAADLRTESSGGGLRRQVPVLSANMASRRGGSLPNGRYNGYSVAPIPIDRRRLLLAEWDRSGHEDRTLRVVSLRTPRAATFAFDLNIQPWVYWHRILKGKV